MVRGFEKAILDCEAKSLLISEPNSLSSSYLNFLHAGQVVGSPISIKNLGLTQKLTQTIAERAFACGNSPGDPNRGHSWLQLKTEGNEENKAKGRW